MEKMTSNNLMKKCPFCAEEIRFEAIKCRFCGETLPVISIDQVATPEDKTQQENIHQKTKEGVTLFRVLLCVPFLIFFTLIVIGMWQDNKAADIQISDDKIRAPVLKEQLEEPEQLLDPIEEARVRKLEGVRIGMTSDRVLESSWGKPERINRTTNAWSTREQWVYKSGSYLYFENGRLTTVQN